MALMRIILVTGVQNKSESHQKSPSTFQVKAEVYFSFFMPGFISLVSLVSWSPRETGTQFQFHPQTSCVLLVCYLFYVLISFLYLGHTQGA